MILPTLRRGGTSLQLDGPDGSRRSHRAVRGGRATADYSITTPTPAGWQVHTGRWHTLRTRQRLAFRGRHQTETGGVPHPPDTCLPSVTDGGSTTTATLRQDLRNRLRGALCWPKSMASGYARSTADVSPWGLGAKEIWRRTSRRAQGAAVRSGDGHHECRRGSPRAWATGKLTGPRRRRARGGDSMHRQRGPCMRGLSLPRSSPNWKSTTSSSTSGALYAQRSLLAGAQRSSSCHR